MFRFTERENSIYHSIDMFKKYKIVSLYFFRFLHQTTNNFRTENVNKKHLQIYLTQGYWIEMFTFSTKNIVNYWILIDE